MMQRTRAPFCDVYTSACTAMADAYIGRIRTVFLVILFASQRELQDEYIL